MGMLIFLFNHTWVWVSFVVLFCFSKIDSRILQLEARHRNTRSREVSCTIPFDFYEMRVTAGIRDSVSTSSPYLHCAFSKCSQVPSCLNSIAWKFCSRDCCSPGLQHMLPSALVLHSKSKRDPTECLPATSNWNALHTFAPQSLYGSNKIAYLKVKVCQRFLTFFFKEGSGVCFFSFSMIIQVLVRGKLWAQVLYFSGNECISLAFLKYHTFNFELFIQIFLFPAVFWTFDLCEAVLCLTLLVLKAIKYKMNRWKGIVNPHWEIIWQFLSHGKISTKWNLFNIDEWDSNAPREK